MMSRKRLEFGCRIKDMNFYPLATILTAHNKNY